MKAEFDNATIKSSDEIWKSVKGYEGLYEVSNIGRIKSLKKWRRCGKIVVTFKKKRF